MSNERPSDAAGNLMVDFSPAVRLNVWLTGDRGADMVRLVDITASVRGWLASDDALRARLMPDRPRTPSDAPQQAHVNGAASAPPQQPPPRGGQQRSGSGLFCPDHPNIHLIQSAPQYQEYDDVDGEQVPAKFFCPGKENGTGKNHSVWRSKAVKPFQASDAPPIEDDLVPSDAPF